MDSRACRWPWVQTWGGRKRHATSSTDRRVARIPATSPPIQAAKNAAGKKKNHT